MPDDQIRVCPKCQYENKFPWYIDGYGFSPVECKKCGTVWSFRGVLGTMGPKKEDGSQTFTSSTKVGEDWLREMRESMEIPIGDMSYDGG